MINLIIGTIAVGGVSWLATGGSGGPLAAAVQ